MDDTYYLFISWLIFSGTPLALMGVYRLIIWVEGRKDLSSRDIKFERPRKITPEIQAEIDQTPEWWDREFRKLSGEPEPVKSDLTGGEWKLHLAQMIKYQQSELERITNPQHQFVDPEPPTTSEFSLGGWIRSDLIEIDRRAMAKRATERRIPLYVPSAEDEYTLIPAEYHPAITSGVKISYG